MREVEAQIIRRDDRAGLLDVRAEDFAQSCVKQVRRRVIAPRRVAFFRINLRRHFIADAQSAALDCGLDERSNRSRARRYR